jgi:peptidoglycan/xylan/chitin deacetylase (PgdA/CDA1 family)
MNPDSARSHRLDVVPRRPRPLVLTFDDGPGPLTQPLLDVLARHQARATFFLLGKSLLGHGLPDGRAGALAAAARATREGHALGNHTMSHTAPLTAVQLTDEIEACDGLLAGIHEKAGTNLATPAPVRLPFGPYRPDGPLCLETLRRIGRAHCHWTGDPQDWRPGQPAARTADLVLRHVTRQWNDGRVPVVLMHDAGGDRQQTLLAVDQILGQFADQPIDFLTVPACDPALLAFREPGQARGPRAASDLVQAAS